MCIRDRSIEFTVNSDEYFEASTTLEVGQSYNIEASATDYFITNETIEVTEEMHDRMRIQLYKANELICLLYTSRCV